MGCVFQSYTETLLQSWLVGRSKAVAATEDIQWSLFLCVSSAGIIAVVIFTILCTLVFLIRYMFRHKGTYHTNEAKGSGESAGESADTAIIGTDNPETIDESKKEWFI